MTSPFKAGAGGHRRRWLGRKGERAGEGQSRPGRRAGGPEASGQVWNWDVLLRAAGAAGGCEPGGGVVGARGSVPGRRTGPGRARLVPRMAAASPGFSSHWWRFTNTSRRS